MGKIFGIWLLWLLWLRLADPWLARFFGISSSSANCCYDIIVSYGIITTLAILLLRRLGRLTSSSPLLINININSPLKLLGFSLTGILLTFFLGNFFNFIRFGARMNWPWQNHDIPFLIKALIVAPIFEEVFYRCYIQTILWKHFKSKTKAILLTLLLFDLGHLKIKREIAPEKTSAVSAEMPFFLESIIYGSLHIASGNNILVPISIHSADNAISLSFEASKPLSRLSEEHDKK